MRLRRTALFLFIVIAASYTAAAWQAPAAKPDKKALLAKLEQLRAEANVPGLMFSYILPDGSEETIAVGQADVEAKLPLTPAHRLPAGSVGKMHVAVTILKAVAAGKLTLDENISRWFDAKKDPWFAKVPNAEQLTLRMLLNHTAGLGEHVLKPGFIDELHQNPDRQWKPEELMSYVAGDEPLFEAGKSWSYADTNFVLAGIAFERATGKPLFIAVEQEVLKPLKLAQTEPQNGRRYTHLAVGYSRPDSPFKKSGRVVDDGAFFFDPQMEYAGGGLISNPRDLAHFVKALYEDKVLPLDMKKEHLDAVETVTGRGGGPGVRYGLGVLMRPSQWGETWGHSGWFPGYITEVEYFPQLEIAASMQTNTDATPANKKSVRRMMHEMLELLAPPPEKAKD